MKMQLKVNRICATMLDRISDVCEWDTLTYDEIDAIHTEFMHRVISRMYQDISLGQKKYKKNTTQVR